MVSAPMAAWLVLQAAVDRGPTPASPILLAVRTHSGSLGIPVRLSFVGVLGLGYRAPNDRSLGSTVVMLFRPLAM